MNFINRAREKQLQESIHIFLNLGYSDEEIVVRLPIETKRASELVTYCRYSNSLFQSIDTQDTETIRSIISKNRTILESKNKQGATPLIYAAKANCFPMVYLLVELGSDISARTNSEQNSLMWAFFHCNCQMISYLIESGANLNEYSDGESIVSILLFDWIKPQHAEKLLPLLARYSSLFTPEIKEEFHRIRLKTLLKQKE